MLNHIHSTRSSLSALLFLKKSSVCLFVFLATLNSSHATGWWEKARNIAKKMDAFEEKERLKLAEKITEQTEKTVKKLEKLAKRAKAKGNDKEASAILKYVKILKPSNDLSDKEDNDLKPAKPIIFAYNRLYIFEGNLIQGRLRFNRNGRIKVWYEKDGVETVVMWNRKDLDDHIYVSDAGEFGQVYISDVPDSDQQSIMIRWGGKLRHQVITATTPN